MTKTANFVKY